MRWWLSFVIAAAVAALWLASAFSHLQNQYAFFRSILGYQLLPARLAAISAGVLPWWLLALGVALLQKPFRRAAAWASALTGLLFVGAQASSAFRGLDISCGCFGAEGPKIYWTSMVPAALALVGGAAVGWLERPRAGGGTCDAPVESAAAGASALWNCSSSSA